MPGKPDACQCAIIASSGSHQKRRLEGWEVHGVSKYLINPVEQGALISTGAEHRRCRPVLLRLGIWRAWAAHHSKSRLVSGMSKNRVWSPKRTSERIERALGKKNSLKLYLAYLVLNVPSAVVLYPLAYSSYRVVGRQH